jgi:ParB family chromosome partitioning protein
VYESAAEAIEVSASENIHREDMHPADQFEAFQAMLNGGRSIEDVAARFSVSAHTVRQRLKLANVAPKLIALFRKGEIELAQMIALSITNDQKRQVRVWEKATHWQRNPDELRRQLTSGDTPGTDPTARFVGVEAYEAAGGVVYKDLFSEQCYFRDAELLQKMATAKLDDVAKQIEAEGWRWVEVTTDSSRLHSLHNYTRSQPSYRKATEEETAAAAALDAEGRKLEKGIEKAADRHERQQRIRQIGAELETLNAARVRFGQAAKSLGGVLIVLDHKGTLRIERGLVRPADKRAADKAKAKATNARTDGAAETTDTGLSQSLCQSLSAQRTRALQALMIDNPNAALIAVTHNLLKNLCYGHLGRDAADALQIHARQIDAGGDDTKAAQHVRAAIEAVTATLPQEPTELFGWLCKQEQSTLLQLLAVGAAPTICTTQSNEGRHEAADALAGLLNLDMADWWEPQGDNYLARVSKDAIAQAVTEGAGKDAAASLAGLKKGAAVARADELLAGLRWLPGFLRPAPAG